VELAAHAAKECLTVRETERRAREAAKAVGVQQPVTGENSTVIPVRPSDAIAKPTVEIQKTITEENRSPLPCARLPRPPMRGCPWTRRRRRASKLARRWR